MLDRQFIVENAELVKQNCARRNSHGRRGSVRRAWSRRGRRKQQQVDELNRQANEVSKSIGKAKDAAEREARKEEGRQLRELMHDGAGRAGRDHSPRPTRSCGRFPTCRIPTRRSAPTTRPTARSAAASTSRAKFDFKPLDHVAARREAGPDRFRGGREGRRARLLLPEERRRAAGAGPAAVRARPAASTKVSRRRSRPTWRATRFCTAPASSRAGRRRRSTASRTAT